MPRSVASGFSRPSMASSQVSSVYLNSELAPKLTQTKSLTTIEFFRQCCEFVCKSLYFQVFMFLVSFYSICGDFIYTSAVSSSISILNLISYVVFGLLLFEIFIKTVGKSGYFFSYYFLIDLISAIFYILHCNIGITDLLFNKTTSLSDLITSTTSTSSSTSTWWFYTLDKKPSQIGRLAISFHNILLYFIQMRCNMKNKSIKVVGVGGVDGGSSSSGSGVVDVITAAASVVKPKHNAWLSIPRTKIGLLVYNRMCRWGISIGLIMYLLVPLYSGTNISSGSATSLSNGSSNNYNSSSGTQYYVDLLVDDIRMMISNSCNNVYTSNPCLNLRTIYEQHLINFIITTTTTTTTTCSIYSTDCITGSLSYIGIYKGTMNTFTPGLVIYTTKTLIDTYLQSTDTSLLPYSNYSMSQSTVDWLTGTWETTKYCQNDTFLADTTVSSVIVNEDGKCPSDYKYGVSTKIITLSRLVTEPLFVVVLTYDQSMVYYMQQVIGVSIYIAVCIFILLVMFHYRLDSMVLKSVESTLLTVDSIRIDPLTSIALGEQLYHRDMDLENKRKKNMENKGNKWWTRKHAADIRVEEALMLERAVVKLGSLLVLGFGEAGSEMINQQLKENANRSGLNVIAAGKKVKALFAYISIKHFPILTEVLQEKVLLFVNQLSEIVHGIADEYHGSASKNTGSAFLLTWRITHPAFEQRFCDLATLAVTKILVAVHRCPRLSAYGSHPALLQRLPNFHVELTIGLHVGEAIEGPVGSEFKIDASYVGRDVATTVAIENLNHQYGTKVLLSGAIFDKLSVDVADVPRKIDSVAIDKKSAPIAVYTVDLDFSKLSKKEPKRANDENLTREQQIMQETIEKYKLSEERKQRKAFKISTSYEVGFAFSGQESMIAIREKFTDNKGILFSALFQCGFLNYECGEWEVAKESLESCLNFFPDYVDGPSKRLLDIMGAYNFKKPKDWQGHREL